MIFIVVFLVNFSANMKYFLKLDNPVEFYHETHRPAHFLNFVDLEAGGEGGGGEGGEAIDLEDYIA